MAALAAILAPGPDAMAQTVGGTDREAAPTADNAVMLTIFFKHDKSRPLSELNAQLESRVTTRRFRRRASKWCPGM